MNRHFIFGRLKELLVLNRTVNKVPIIHKSYINAFIIF